jgi:hypothetical protein
VRPSDLIDEGQRRDGDVVGSEIKESIRDAKACRGRQHAGVQDLDGTAGDAAGASAPNDNIGREVTARVDRNAAAAKRNRPT